MLSTESLRADLEPQALPPTGEQGLGITKTIVTEPGMRHLHRKCLCPPSSYPGAGQTLSPAPGAAAFCLQGPDQKPPPP
jgi:hypothetical protein